MKKITANIFQEALNYQAYRTLIDDKLEQRQTTGTDHSEAMLHYTFMNVARMRRLDKTTRLTEETITDLEHIQQATKWLVITEGWCGDAAQIIPVLVKIAEQNQLVDIRFIMRDEHPIIMDAFLTNGARSIPMVILMNDDLEVLGTWGPRPAEVQAEVMSNKQKLAALTDDTERMLQTEESKKFVQLWYAKDKTKKIQAEFVTALKKATRATALG